MMKVICFGEVLWDLLPSGKVAGGAPMNVAVHLRNMGINTTVISRVGNDDLGNKLIDFVKSKGVESKFLQIDENQETGVVNVDVSNPTDVKYDIAMPCAWDYISCEAPVLNAVSTVNAFVYGSLASRTAVSRAAVLELLEAAKYRVFDVNLRLPHFEKETLELLMEKADMVKLNDEEIVIITNWYASEITDMAAQMSFLKSKFNLDRICVTRGENGAILMDGKGVYAHDGFSIEVADTIGSGDAFLACLLKNLLCGEPPQKAIENACAMGAIVASHFGATPTVEDEKIKKLFN